ncbi:MAG: CPBP family intramembrane glutamic endopeptidase [Acidimicrobiales bacterium]
MPGVRDRETPDTPGASGAGEFDAGLGRSDVPLDRQLQRGTAPVSARSAGMWLLLGALGFLLGQVVGAVFSVLAAVAEGKLHSLSAIANLSEPPTWYIVSTLLGLWVGFLGGPLLASAVRGTRSLVRDVGLRFKWIDLIGIPIGVAGQFLVAAIYIPIASHVHNFNQKFNAPSQKLTGGSHGIGFAVIAILTVAGAPFFEEIFFRGLLLRSLARLFGNFGRWVGPALAIVVTGVLFGLAHAESLQLVGLATFGIILSFISYRTGRLGMNMVAHAAFNLVAVVAIVAAGTGVLF